jgi:ATP-binding cassette subfamily B protein
LRDFRQHDETDCGAACLAFIFHHYGKSVSLSVIRQRSGTNRGGTTALGLVDTCRNFGFSAKGVRCQIDDLRAMPLPGIAHVTLEGGRQHYVVVVEIRKSSIKIMDPAVGRIAKWPLDKFKQLWTNVIVLATPSIGFVKSENTKGPWTKLLALVAPQKHVLLQAFIGIVLGTLLSLSTAIYIQKIVDNVIVDGNHNLLRLLGCAMLIVLVARIVLGYFQSLLMLKSAQRIDAGLILGYYRHLMRLPQSFFDTMRVGEITSRVRDAVAIRDFLNSTILGLVVNPLILICSFAAMFVYSWKLALFSMLLLPANLAIYFISDWRNRRYQRQIMERSADFDAQLVESLHAISVVRSCGLEERMTFRSETRLVRMMESIWHAANSGLAINSAGTFTTQAYSIGLLWIGASLVLDTQLTAGELMSCNALAGYLTGPMLAIIGMNTSIRTATAATDRLYEILDLEREKDEGTAELLLDGTFTLAADRINFSHAGRLATLRDISLEFRSGTMTALTGLSGCGKSTLLAILQRYYPANEGTILVNGIDFRYFKLAGLRSQIGYVPQRIDMLAGTVLENIAPNEAHPNIVRIVDLCRRMGILDFIESLPRGFQTLITENGANLSGGQKQRLAIVRALYLDAPILLLDEPSSALDTESEHILMGILRDLRDDGKLIVLAVHNKSLVEISDRVVEMRAGKVVSDTIRRAFSPKDVSAEARNGHLNPSPGLSLECQMEAPNVATTLFHQLKDCNHKGLLFGQTDANVMGIDSQGKGWFMESNRCDIHTITGKYPALFGFDVQYLSKGWSRFNSHIIPKILEAHLKGAVVTIGWHPENLITGGDSYSGSGVNDVLPGASGNQLLVNQLDSIADKLGNLKAKDGTTIPIIFRPWHEPNGGHFWWGNGRCTPTEYVRLFQFTVDYLRKERRVDNFLFCFSPGLYSDRFEDSMALYPGNEYVDIVGLDAYGDHSNGHQERFLAHTRDLVCFAEANGKIPALTEIGFKKSEKECGLHFCQNTSWLTKCVIGPLKADPIARRVRYITFWRNEAYNPINYYLPYPGSPHEEDLIKASRDDFLIFADRLRDSNALSRT